MGVALVALTAVVVLVYAFSGAIKVFGVQRSLANRDRFGIAPRLWRAIGWLEWAGAVGVLVGLWVPVLGVLAAAGLCALMLGAIMTRLRVRDPALAVAGDVAVLALAGGVLVLRVLTWL